MSSVTMPTYTRHIATAKCDKIIKIIFTVANWPALLNSIQRSFQYGLIRINILEGFQMGAYCKTPPFSLNLKMCMLRSSRPKSVA